MERGRIIIRSSSTMIESKRNRKSLFVTIAEKAVSLSGESGTFLLAVCAIVVWAITGPIFGFNDTWQLVINTSTTIVTFLMVFLIQNAQNRDTRAMEIKLDELLRVTPNARTVLLDLEELTEHELEAIQKKYEAMAENARKAIKSTRQKGDISDFIPNDTMFSTSRKKE